MLQHADDDAGRLDSKPSQTLASTSSTFSNWSAVSGSSGAFPEMISLISLDERPHRRAKISMRKALYCQTLFENPPQRNRIVRTVLIGRVRHVSLLRQWWSIPYVLDVRLDIMD